jgi:TonB family protein
VLVKDRQLWFSSDDEAVDEEVATVATPHDTAQPRSEQASEKSKIHTSAKASDETPAPEPPAVVETQRSALQPLDVQVVAGNRQRVLPAGGSNALQVEIPANSGEWRVWPPAKSSGRFGSTVFAAERQPLPVDGAQASQGGGVATPLLTKQMKVRGSVVLQALVSADGNIEELRVLSGPAALAPAAREALRQWRFKPYLQNGQPVETQANITVNFLISTT